MRYCITIVCMFAMFYTKYVKKGKKSHMGRHGIETVVSKSSLLFTVLFFCDKDF